VSRVLVTGASGFIGRHTLPRLLESGFEVHAVSRDSRSGDDVGWHRCDLLDPAAGEALVRELEPTHLLHLAWYAEPGLYWTAAENVRWLEASLRLLRTFSATGRRAVTAGTCAEYDWSFGVCSERETPLRPATLYGECKRSLSSVGERLAAQAGLSLASARVFFVYGPGEHPERVVASVVASLLRGEDALCTTGTQVRDYLHVADVASAFVELLRSDVTGPVNVGSGEPLPVRRLLSTIGEAVGAPDLIRFGERPERPGEPPLIVADTRRLVDEVGWSAHHTLRSGIADTVAWWRERLAAPHDPAAASASS
jgi:nucleoside-diphosphate-sugar epimerase